MQSKQKILEDLYLIDPSLKAHEQKLITLIDELMKSKPDTHFDESFARELKKKLLLQPAAVAEKASFWSFLAMPRLAFTGGAFALVLAVAVLVSQPDPSSLQVQFGTAEVSRVKSQAFGSLGGGSATANSATEATSAPMAYGMGGGRGGDGAGAATMLGQPDAISSKMIAPGIVAPYYSYTFSYKGEAFDLKDKTLDVFKRTKSENGDMGLAQALMGASLNGINLRSFANAGLTSFELAQSTPDGYSISVNLREGTIGINGGNNYYRTMPANCDANGCTEQYKPLTLAEVPADSKLIAVADQFVKDHGIDISSYGTPEVDNTWRAYASQGEQMYVPDSVSVRYPLRLNETMVYDQGGNKTGITITVNIRENKVMGAWQIQNQDYQASAYEAETDAARIIKLAGSGGNGGRYYYGGDTKKVELELGTPEGVYIMMWNYKDGISNELYVPALRFPITNAPETLYQKNVIVPLAKDLIQDGTSIPPSPIMYMKGSEGVSGPAIDLIAPTPAVAPKKQ